MAESAWESLEEEIRLCEACPLHSGCAHKVPGQGDKGSPLMLIGEGPGQREDETGYAFVGAAGQLLTQLLSEVGIFRDRLYICNVVKCRPPQNRVPEPEEQAACLPFLRRQLELVQPQVVVLLGATAGRAVLGSGIRVTRDRGKWYQANGTYFLLTYHPSALLRDTSKQQEARQDLRSLRSRLVELGLTQTLAQ